MQLQDIKDAVGFFSLDWQTLVMLAIGGILIYLGIAKNVEPVLLIPIGTGIILANIPLGGVTDQGEPKGVLFMLREAGIDTELFPLLIFIGIGAMIDFGPFLERPYTILLGAAAQFGIFGTFMLAYFLGDGWLHIMDFSLRDAASIGVIGSADGPTSIYVATQLGTKYVGAIVVAAYSYMALVPIIQPPVMRLLTTKKERQVRMSSVAVGVSQRTKILFPIITTVVVGLIAPKATPLIGFLMFGNLLREARVVKGLSGVAQDQMANIVTILLGITVGGMMGANEFLRWGTILVFIMGLVAFALDTAAGVFLGKIMYWITRGKVNPLIGAAGISAFPMSSRVVQKEGLKANRYSHLLMHAAGANTAGQIASVVAGGALLMIVLQFS